MILSTAVGLAAFISVYALFRRFTRPSLSMIRGPKSPSFIFGNLLQLFQRPVGEAEFAWQSQYGNVVRFKSIFGVDRLVVSDPKALQKILSTSAYSFPKPHNFRVVMRMLNGEGLLWATGEDHKRQRSIMLPGFGQKECKAFMPIFKDCVEYICMKWAESVWSGNDGVAVINTLEWLSRGALDALGQAVFDVQFNTLKDRSHPLAIKYRNFLADVFGLPSAKQIFIQAASAYIPTRILRWITDNVSYPRLARARDVKLTVTGVAKELVREKADALLQGKGKRDVFTLLVKANMDATAKKKLSEEELLSEMCTILLAGHETTSISMSFIFLELSRHPKVQSKLRDEIRKTEAIARERGDLQLTATDLESMPYLNAVIKEGLRLHPPGAHNFRVALQDDIIPLSKPILTKSGDMINEVLVPKGTEMVISYAAYNRDRDIWGEDAYEFIPDRWLDGSMEDRKLPGLGVYPNVMAFSSGVQACLGWRFALVEMQTFIATLVGKFEFSMSDKAERILRLPVLVTAPMVDGELDRGVQMPLTISLARQDHEM